MEKGAFCLLLLLTANLAEGLTDQCFQTGECRDSVNVGVSTITDEFACLDLCKANQECKWFTFSTLTNLCLLFTDCQVLDVELCPECLSGQQGCIPDGPVCNIQGSCSGVLDRIENLPSLEDCLQVCQSSFGCRWVTYELASLECLLYKTCPSLDESCNYCISSERRCIDYLSTTTEDTTTTEYITTTEDSTTTTADVTTPSPAGFTKLAVFTGFDAGKYDRRVFVIDLEDPSNKCKNLIDIPIKCEAASGFLFDSKPIFCGGYDGSEVKCDCFTYEQSQWVSVAPMPTCRSFSASAGLLNQEDRKSRFVIAGGYNSGELSNVESYDGTFWHSLPDLPAPKYAPCLVAINETVLLSIGGEPLTTETFFYNAELNQWLPGPELLKARSLASCAMVEWKNPADGQLEAIVVVAGGFNGKDYLSSTELLYINDISKGWQPGPELPLTVHGSVMVEYNDSLVLIGGFGEVDGRHFYQLTSQDGPWIEMEQTLPIGKYYHLAFLIPDELTDCQQD